MKHLFSNPDALSEVQAAQSVRETALWVILCALILLKGLLWFLGLPIDFESPFYLLQANIRVGLLSLSLGLLRSATVLGLGFASVQWLENSKFGQRVKENKAVLFAAVFIAIAMAFGFR